MNQPTQNSTTQADQLAQQTPSIYEFLYSPYRAQEVIQSRELPNYFIQSVDVIDPNESSIRIVYLKQGTAITLEVPFLEFLTPFWSVRRNRGKGYTAIAKALNRVDVQSKTDQKPPHTVVSDAGKLLCTCQDFRNQELAFKQHPYLWTAIEEQPHCKHIFCAAEKLQKLSDVSSPVLG